MIRQGTRKTGDQLLQNGLGFGGWSINPQSRPTTFAAAANTAYAAAVGIPGGTTITNIIFALTTIPTTNNPTSTRVGVLNSSRVCLAVSGDIGTAMKSMTIGLPLAHALSAPYVTLADDLYFLVYWMEGSFSGTAPVFHATSGQNQAALSGFPLQAGTINATGADLTVSSTYTITNANGIWLAWN